MEQYTQTAQEWLEKWDKNKICWTIEMGGMGPGYEQCIHITVAEVLRFLLAENPDHTKWVDDPEDEQAPESWPIWREKIRDSLLSNPVINKLGLSGAQAGAAMSLGTRFYMKGPAVAFTEVPNDRLIQVSKRFPDA